MLSCTADIKHTVSHVPVHATLLLLALSTVISHFDTPLLSNAQGCPCVPLRHNSGLGEHCRRRLHYQNRGCVLNMDCTAKAAGHKLCALFVELVLVCACKMLCLI